MRLRLCNVPAVCYRYCSVTRYGADSHSFYISATLRRLLTRYDLMLQTALEQVNCVAKLISAQIKSTDITLSDQDLTSTQDSGNSRRIGQERHCCSAEMICSHIIIHTSKSLKRWRCHYLFQDGALLFLATQLPIMWIKMSSFIVMLFICRLMRLSCIEMIPSLLN